MLYPKLQLKSCSTHEYIALFWYQCCPYYLRFRCSIFKMKFKNPRYLHIWCEDVFVIFGVSMSEPHTSVVYGNTCIDRPTIRPPDRPSDRPTDRVLPIHMIRIRCTCPRWHAVRPCQACVRVCTWWWTVQCIVLIAIRPRMPTMGKRKAETPAQWSVKLKRERDQRISSYLRSLVGVAILGFHVRQCSCWSLHTNPFSHYYIPYFF